MVKYFEAKEEPKRPDSMYYTLLFKKDNNLIAVGMLNKLIKYIPKKLYEEKYKSGFLSIMRFYIDHCIEMGKESFEYDEIVESYTEIKEFRKNPYKVDTYFVDIDTVESSSEEEYENFVRNVVHKYVNNNGYGVIDFEVGGLRSHRPYGTSISNGSGRYEIKKKDEQEWIASLFKDKDDD